MTAFTAPSSGVPGYAVLNQHPVLMESWQKISKSEGGLAAIGSAFVNTTLANFAARFPTVESAAHVPFLHDHAKAGQLVCLNAFVQHDSIGEQFYVPVTQSSDGTISPFDSFNCTPEQYEIMDMSVSNLVGRKLVVAVPMSLPKLSANSVSNSKILLKFYDNYTPRVNQVIRVVGFYEPAHPYDEADDEPIYPHNLHSMHVVSVLQSMERVDCVDYSNSRRDFLEMMESLSSTGEAFKILMALMSKIVVRTQGLVSSLLVGYYPLNIQVPIADTGDTLATFLASLVSHSTVIRLSSEFLNNNIFASSLDPATGELRQGLLQIPDESMVIIDERFLQPGKLSEMATSNMQHLMDFINHQAVTYDFVGQAVQIPTNAIVIVISHGKSLFKLDNLFNLTTPFTLHSKANDQLFDYFTSCRDLNVRITEQLAADIITMIESRAQNLTTRIEPNRLASALTIARLVSASYGSAEMQMKHLEEALGHC